MTVQQQITDYWDARARAYEESQREFREGTPSDDVWRGVWRRVLPPSGRVLDLGTGSGQVAHLLAGLGYDVTGVDASPAMLGLARARGGGDRAPAFVLGDAVRPPVGQASVDVVTARYLLWTLRSPVDALRRWRQLLRPAGLVAIVDSMWFPGGIGADEPATHGETPDEFRRHYAPVVDHLPLAQMTSIEPLRQVVVEAGFDDVVVHELTDVLALDQEYGVAPGHEVQMKYLVTGRV